MTFDADTAPDEAPEATRTADFATTDLVPSVSIENFLAQRDAMIERAHVARRALLELHAIAAAMPVPTTGGSCSWYGLELHSSRERSDFTGAHGFDTYLRSIDAACWARLLDLSGLRTFMDAKARKEWDENIHACKVPELTYANVEATFRAMHDCRRDMFERGVIEVFRALSWDYKTNNPVMFGKRIILRYLYDTRLGLISVGHTGASRLDDIMRALCILDGKPEPDHRQGAYFRLANAKLAPTDFDGYFTVRGFKNGNGHLTFTRPDLVERMNQIIARHYPGALPPGRDD